MPSAEGRQPVQVLLLTRGDLCEAWLRATEETRGAPLTGIETLALGWRDSCDSDHAHVRNTLATMRARGPVLVLTDLYGSTPTNLACEHASDPGVVVVAGANLAMVLRLACEDRSTRDPVDLAEWICAKGRSAIRRIGGGEP